MVQIRALPGSGQVTPNLYTATATERTGGDEAGPTSIPGAGLQIDTATMPTATSGVYYEQTVAVSGETGTVVMIDVSPSVSPGSNRYSPRNLFLHPYLRKYMGTPIA